MFAYPKCIPEADKGQQGDFRLQIESRPNRLKGHLALGVRHNMSFL